MSNPPNHPGLSGHSVHGTTLSGLGPNHSNKDTSGNSQSTVNVTLCFNSTSTFISQNQALPVSGQLVSHHHVDAARTRRSNLSIPFGLHTRSSSDSYPIRSQNPVNINIIVGHNSSVNINLLRGNPSSQSARNHLFATSSSAPPNMNNVYNPASSYFQQPFLNLDPNQEPIPNRSSETNERPQFIRHHSKYAFPVVATPSEKTPSTYVTDYEQEIPTAIPCLRQNTVNLSPHQGRPSHPCRIPSRNHTISQSGMGLSLFNQPSRYHSPGDKHNHFLALPSSTLNSPKNQVLIPGGGNGKFHENSFHPQPNLPTFPESHLATEVTEQAPEPNFDRNPLIQRERLQAPSQVPSQNGNKTATIVPASPTRRGYDSAMRRKSQPYVKYGPYTCPECNVVFECVHRYASHFHIHYKGETPAERKKRREGKRMRNRDLHIAESTDGIRRITVMSGPAANITDGIANKSNQGEHSAFPIIKEEV